MNRPDRDARRLDEARHPATPRRREQLIAAVAKVGVPEAVRRIESIAQDHDDP